MTQTLEQWEAEKARIDEERTRLYERLLPYVGMLTASNVSIEHFPYPPKPEKTVTLSRGRFAVTLSRGGFEYKRVDGMVCWRSHSNGRWYELYSLDDLRALASLLPENQEKDG